MGGRVSIVDERRLGRPVSALTTLNIKKAHEIVANHRLITISLWNLRGSG